MIIKISQHLTFSNDLGEKRDLCSCYGFENDSDVSLKGVRHCCKSNNVEATLLDLYSGCGGMSTGLCLGARLSGLNLVTVSILSHSILNMFWAYIIPFSSLNLFHLG